MRKIILSVVLVVLLTACNAPFVAQPATQTPIPTVTPQPTLTPEPTLIPITLPTTAAVRATFTASAADSTRPELDCKVLSQSLKNGAKFTPRERFDISWMIQNTGSATWEPGVVELAYAGGNKLYHYQPIQLTHSSPPGDIMTLSADMIAPQTRNDYSMVWALRRGDEYFCRMYVSIRVRR